MMAGGGAAPQDGHGESRPHGSRGRQGRRPRGVRRGGHGGGNWVTAAWRRAGRTTSRSRPVRGSDGSGWPWRCSLRRSRQNLGELCACAAGARGGRGQLQTTRELRRRRGGRWAVVRGARRGQRARPARARPSDGQLHHVPQHARVTAAAQRRLHPNQRSTGVRPMWHIFDSVWISRRSGGAYLKGQCTRRRSIRNAPRCSYAAHAVVLRILFWHEGQVQQFLLNHRDPLPPPPPPPPSSPLPVNPRPKLPPPPSSPPAIPPVEAAKGVISCASQEVRDLYNLMEHDFLPLDLASKVQPLLSKISAIGGKLSAASSVPEIQLSKYQSLLEKLTALRVLQQASQIFQSMKIDMLSRMIPFFDFNVVEKIAVDAVKHNFVAMKVNHLSGAVHFGNMDIESDGLSTHLSILADSLNKARCLIYPPVHKPSKIGENLTSLSGVVEKEHRRLLARKSIIEKRKEDHERQILEKEKEEETKKLSIQKKSAEEERERLLKEQRAREQQRIRREIEEKEQKEAESMIADNIKVKKGEKHVIDGREIELRKQHHVGDLQEKNRLSRLLEHKNAFQERIVQRRESEFSSLRKERDERIDQF